MRTAVACEAFARAAMQRGAASVSGAVGTRAIGDFAQQPLSYRDTGHKADTGHKGLMPGVVCRFGVVVVAIATPALRPKQTLGRYSVGRFLHFSPLAQGPWATVLALRAFRFLGSKVTGFRESTIERPPRRVTS